MMAALHSSPKHSPHPHSPSSSSSGHSSPRSPPSHPPSSHPQPPSSHPPPLPHHTRSANTSKQRPPPHNQSPSMSHASRSKSHDMQYSYHGDPNKAGSQRQVPIPPSSLHYSSSADHAPRQHHQRFSPEDIQAETGERGGVKADPKSTRSHDNYHLQSAVLSRNPPGKGSVTQGKGSGSYDPQVPPGAQLGGVANEAGEVKGARGGREGGVTEVIQTNHVAHRVAQFNQTSGASNTGEGGGGTPVAGRRKEKTPSPSNIRSPELEKATQVTLSPGSSEEELNSINQEETEEAGETIDGAYYPHRAGGFPVSSAGMSSNHPQLSQPTYLTKMPPTSHPQLTHNPASYPSLSQPHLIHYETTTAHSRLPQEVPFGGHSGPHMTTGIQYDPKKAHPVPSSQHHQKHSSHGHQHQTHYRNQPPPGHDHHQRSHDHHMTGPPGSREHHTMAHPGSRDQHMMSHPGPHDHHMTAHHGSHDHHMTAYAAMEQQHHRGYRQQIAAAHPQRKGPSISKQSLSRAHDAAANGDLTTLVGELRQ